MRKIKEVLLLHALGLRQRQIARSCSIGQSTVSDYIQWADAAGLRWLDIADWDESRVLAALGPNVPTERARSRLPAPDFGSIHAELQQHKHLTLQLVWEEYRTQHPEGYRYSRFCELYQRWRRNQEVVLRQEHRAGEKLFVDYAGDTIGVQDPTTGEIRQVQLFVAVLGASNYTFAEATWTQGLGDWIGSHIRAFEFFGAVPEIVVPDNLKSGVSRSLPLRARRESHLRRDGATLRRSRGAGASVQAARQGQSRSRRAGGRALDSGRLAQAQLSSRLAD